MKYSQWIGVLAVIILIISCFLPWTWYPDLQKYFTGFFSENNHYGKPGKLFIVLGSISVLLFLTPRIWAKRWNILLGAVTLAWAIKCFIEFSACYRGICPQKQLGLWIMLSSAILIIAAALFPDTSVKEIKNGSPE